MLKKEEWIVFGVFLLFAFLFVSFNHDESMASITGFAVEGFSDPSLDVSLTKTQLSSEEPLDGYVNITFTGPFDPSTYVKFEFNGVSYKTILKDYFKSRNISFTETDSSFTVSNPLTSRMINFDSAGVRSFAFMLPKGVSVKSFNMDVGGSAENPPSFPSFEVEDYTGKREWKYFGDFLAFRTDYVYPSSLKVDSEGDPVTLGGQPNHNSTYFCELMELPESKHFKLNAKIKKVADGANIKAVLLSFDGEYAYGGADNCDIPEPSVGAAPAWAGCELAFGTAKQGVYLVCVYYEGGEDKPYYELSRDSTVSDSRFDCPKMSQSLCFQSFSKDYFIGVNVANYTGSLKNTVSWGSGATDQSMNSSVEKFLEDCKEDEVGDCVVPVAVTSESAGTLQLSNLRMDYTEAGGASSYTNKFYDVIQVPGKIIAVDGVSLSNGSESIQLKLSDANFTAPVVPQDYKTLYLEVSLTPGGKVSKPVKVFSSTYIPETGTVEEKIKNAKKVVSDITAEYSEMLDLFGVTLDVSQLSVFESDISSVKSDKNLSIEETASQLNDLEEQVDTYLQDKPKSLRVDTSFRDMYVAEPGDVENVVLEEPEKVYFYQSNAEVSLSVTNYVLEKYDGTKEKYSVVEKTISPKKPLSNVYVYELIPKTLASSVTGINFKNTDYEVVQQDPVVRYSFASLSQQVKILYGVKGVTVTQNMILGLGSIIVPKEEEEIVEKEYECGNGKCETPYEDEATCQEDCGRKKPVPWIPIIILVALLIAGIVYINFYRGKGSFRSLLGKSPFANPQDLEKVKSYIKASQDKGMKKQGISASLLKSGWTKDQIVYAFEDFEWDKKRSLTIGLAPSGKDKMKKLQDFIKKCLQLNMSKEKIENALLQKGWAAEKVKEAFAKVGLPQEKIETEKEKESKRAYYFEESLKEELKK